MRTSITIPDPLFRRAKSFAAEHGISLSQFVSEALRDKLGVKATPGRRRWMRHVGKLKHLHKETQRINEGIGEAFEHVEPETYKPRSPF